MNKVNNEQEIMFMKLALELAQSAYDNDEVPVGAVIIEKRTSSVLAAFANQMRELNSSIAHAEILAIQKATKIINNERLIGCDMYVSLEPCPMCAYAISIARIDRLFFAAHDSKSGGVFNGPKIFESTSCHHKPQIFSGILESESSKLLKSFFKARR